MRSRPIHFLTFSFELSVIGVKEKFKLQLWGGTKPAKPPTSISGADDRYRWLPKRNVTPEIPAQDESPSSGCLIVSLVAHSFMWSNFPLTFHFSALWFLIFMAFRKKIHGVKKNPCAHSGHWKRVYQPRTCQDVHATAGASSHFAVIPYVIGDSACAVGESEPAASGT